MQLNSAEKISLKNFLNAFFRENPAAFAKENDHHYIKYLLKPFDFELRIPLSYHSLTKRHQFHYNAQLITHSSEPQNLHPWCLLGLLMQDVSARHPAAQRGHREFMQRFFNSCENLNIILDKVKQNSLAALFSANTDFELAENGLIAGHQFHPAAKSREGFTKHEFDCYSPELENHFQLHYFLADPAIVFTQSVLEYDANELVKRHFLTENMDDKKIIIPLHPWQANYIQTLPAVKQLIDDKRLINLGIGGTFFTATTSVRTVYSQQSAFMAKLSLNVAITNSVRMQYARELTRGIAAHCFWQSHIGLAIKQQFPQFTPITDPAFMCLRNNDALIEETAILFRQNPFTFNQNNTTPLATLCQDHPFEQRNRFNQLIPLVAKNNHVSEEQASLIWFEQFLTVAIEPLLWLFIHHGVAIEAHQQNLLITIENGLPVKSYYRDNQGYYIIDEAFAVLSKEIDSKILNEFCKGTKEFIAHHFIYYLICNSVFGIINALGTSTFIDEALLMKSLANFIAKCHARWNQSNYLLLQLLNSDTLPFKGNFLTRFYDLDELTAPLEQQSVYVEIENLIKNAHQGIHHE